MIREQGKGLAGIWHSYSRASPGSEGPRTSEIDWGDLESVAITQSSLVQPVVAESSHFLSKATSLAASSSTMSLSQIPAYSIQWMLLSSFVKAPLPHMCQIHPLPPCSLFLLATVWPQGICRAQPCSINCPSSFLPLAL